LVIPPEKKIQLTPEGDILVMPRNKRDEDQLVLAPDAIGWHESDDGYIGLEPRSDKENELVCWVCRRLHAPVPSSVTTYAELRILFKGYLEAS